MAERPHRPIPDVSIIVPTYRRAAYLPRTLETLLGQSAIERCEVIVVDDGSDDDTAALMAGYGPPVHYVARPHAGVAAAIIAGIEASQGAYVMLCNDHDLYDATLLESLAAGLDANPEATLAVPEVVLLSPDATRQIAAWRYAPGLIPGRRFILDRLLPGIGSIASCNMWRLSAARKVDATLGPSCDLDLWLRLCMAGDVLQLSGVAARVRERDSESAFYFRNHALVQSALRIKRPYLILEPDAQRRGVIQNGWRRRVDRSCAASLLRCLEGGSHHERAAIGALARREGTVLGGRALALLAGTPPALALPVLRGLRMAVAR